MKEAQLLKIKEQSGIWANWCEFDDGVSAISLDMTTLP